VKCARDVVEKLVGSPLLDEGQVLAQSTDILVSIVGGADMTIADVNKVMEQLQRRAESANLVMGAAIDDTYEGRLCLTVVATRHSHEPSSDKTSTPRSTKPAAPAKEQKESEFDTNFLSASSTPRGHSRYSAPPPASTPENTAELLNRQTGKTRRTIAKAKQQTLNLEIVSKGRFEKSEPTIHRGEDLDVPTYVRRGVALN
jgi:cell division protein FtsZ